jgi:hypothetical protein
VCVSSMHVTCACCGGEGMQAWEEAAEGLGGEALVEGAEDADGVTATLAFKTTVIFKGTHTATDATNCTPSARSDVAIIRVESSRHSLPGTLDVRRGRVEPPRPRREPPDSPVSCSSSGQRRGPTGTAVVVRRAARAPSRSHPPTAAFCTRNTHTVGQHEGELEKRGDDPCPLPRRSATPSPPPSLTATSLRSA